VTLESIGPADRVGEVVKKFVIGEVLCPVCALDQVNSWERAGAKSIHSCPEAPPNTVPIHRICDFSADCVGNTQWRLGWMSNEDHSEWTAASSTRWWGELRKLPSGYDPTGHARIRPSAGDGPCHDGPSKWHGRRGCSCGHGNRVSSHAYADLAGMYASQKPLLKLILSATRYPLGVAVALWVTILADNDTVLKRRCLTV